MIFERLEPRKVNPCAGESMISMFCPTPGKCSILEVFWYLLLELLGSPIVENMVFRCVWFLFAFYFDFWNIFCSPKCPTEPIKLSSILGTIFLQSPDHRPRPTRYPLPPEPPSLLFHHHTTSTPLRCASRHPLPCRQACRACLIRYVAVRCLACLSCFKEPTLPFLNSLDATRSPVFNHSDFLQRLVPKRFKIDIPKPPKFSNFCKSSALKRTHDQDLGKNSVPNGSNL